MSLQYLTCDTVLRIYYKKEYDCICCGKKDLIETNHDFYISLVHKK